jgi:hypothetical protein
MAAPKIKIHLVPDLATTDHSDHPDVAMSTDFAVLIERACDYTKVGTQPSWIDAGVFLPPEFMIKLKPISPGSRTYEIDIGSGAYHDTDNAQFFISSGDADDISSNIAIGNISSFIVQAWLFNKLDFGTASPSNLNFDVFALRNSQYIGISGSGSSIIDSKFTYIPRFGGYSFTYPEGDDVFESAPASTFWGDHRAIKPQWNGAIGRFDWSGDLNYTVDVANNEITFSNFFYDNFLTEDGASSRLDPEYDEGDVYNVFIRCFVKRDLNEHSSSRCGALNSNFTDNIYYALPHYDLVDNQADPVINITGPPISLLTLIKESGLVQFGLSDYPDSGETVEVEDYTYHTWLRMANDFTNDFIFRTYVKSLEDRIEVYSAANGGLALTKTQGHFHQPSENTSQTQLQFPSFSWADVKITNEVTHDDDGSPTLSDFFIDVLPRGIYSDPTIDNEEIAEGIGGLVDDKRPWDHQEGSREETDIQCYVRATFNIQRLIQKPNFFSGYGSFGNSNTNTNPMSKMNGEQAFILRKWYQDSVDRGYIFQLQQTVPANDHMMVDNQGESGVSPVALYGEGHLSGFNVIYARILYVLYNDDGGGSEIAVASTLKTWSIAIKGSFIE